MKNNFLRLEGKSITNKREENNYLSKSTPEVFPFLKQIDSEISNFVLENNEDLTVFFF